LRLDVDHLKEKVVEIEPQPPPRLHEHLHHLSSGHSTEVKILAHVDHLKEKVEALLDSGAYYNYLSFAVVKGMVLEEIMQPVQNQYVLLGGTDKKLPVLGKVTVSVQLEGTTAEIKCHVFETNRPLIIGLESLVMHFSELFIKRLEELRAHLQQLDLNGEKHSISVLSDLIYPREPYGHNIDSKRIPVYPSFLEKEVKQHYL